MTERTTDREERWRTAAGGAPARRRRSPAARLAGAVALSAAAFLAGCFSLSPEPDLSRYFVLPAETAPVAARCEPWTGFGPVTVPDYLSSQQFLRRSEASVEYVPDAYWAEPVDKGLARALHHRLGSRLGSARTALFPWYDTVRVDWKVAVDVLRFEGGPGGGASLVARWSVARAADSEIVSAAETTVDEEGGADVAEVVAALGRCLDRLADEIAAAVCAAAAAPPSAD